MQTIIKVASSNPISPVGKNIKNVNKVDLVYNQWLLHITIIVDDVNIIRELIDVREKYKSINVLTKYDVDFMIESMLKVDLALKKLRTYYGF